MKRYTCTNGSGIGMRKRRGGELNDEGGGGGILLSAF